MDDDGWGSQHLANTRFAFLAYLYDNLERFRFPIMRRLAALGAQVLAIAPPPGRDDVFAAYGIEYVPFEMAGAKVAPVGDARAVRELTLLLSDLRPDVLQTFSLKANVLGAVAARRASVPFVVSTVTGLGSVYSPTAGVGGRMAAVLVDALTRQALTNVSRVVFQNNDDHAHYLDRKLCRTSQATTIVSSGVDLEAFAPSAVTSANIARVRDTWGLPHDQPVVTMVARLIPDKGVRQFADAAEALRGQATFVMIGPEGEGRRAIPRDERARWDDIGIVVPGPQRNVAEWLAASDVYALPSYYREGVPRASLEALAMGLPIVTTDMPGCRETVVDGENGYLVRPRDAGELIAALRMLIADGPLRLQMGHRSRRLAEERFSDASVVRQHLAMYRDLLDSSVPATVLQGGAR